ncbi:MAG: GAF domain-containing protein [Anaerolineales bacterium]|nr:MAG: GAF domain-containing protein [Anaerolineales bacterium]
MPDGLLFASISAINFVCLIVSLWLGCYIVTRSPRSRVSWLVSATLWSLCGYFLNSLTDIQGPPGEGSLPWWWGWSVAIAVPFWFHLSVSLLSGKLARKQRPLVILVYLLTLNFVAMEAYTPWVFSGATMKPPIYNSAQHPGPLYPLFGLYLIAVPALSLYNLYLSWRQAKSRSIQRQFATLLWATSLAIFSGIYATLSTWLRLDTPTLISNFSLGAGVALLGYGVARYNALIKGRAIGLDFIYTSLAIGLVIGAYLLAAFISDLAFDVPFIAFIFIIMLAIVSHSLYDWARTYLDRFFYRRQYRELRANLRDFAREAVPGHELQEQLRTILETLCRSLDVSKGFIALREGEGFVVTANWQVDFGGQSIASDALATDEIAVLSPPMETLGLTDTPMALIVPLHAGGEQIGVIVLGQRTTGVSYTEDDLDLLEDLADTVASVVHTVRLQKRSVQQIDTLLREVREREQELQGKMREALVAEARPPVLEGQSEREAISLVEDALRHLHDYPYLGEHTLAQLRIIESYLDVQEGVFVTHLDRGKALQEVLTTAIEKLKPPGPQPSPPTREWHQYVILHDCYVLGKLNRDVMSALYISEGTFSRARRRAVRGVTRALAEMETQQKRPA